MSVCPPVRSSVDPSDYLEKEQQQQEECAFSFSLKIKHFPPAARGSLHRNSHRILFLFRFVLVLILVPVFVPFLLAAPAARLGLWLHRMERRIGRTSGQTVHQIYIRTINFNFWSTSNSVWQSGFGLHRDVSIHTYPPLGATKQSYPAYIKL